MLKHMQRSTTNQYERSTTKQSVYLRTYTRLSMLSLPHRFVNSENKTEKKEIRVTSLRNKRSSLVNSENKSKRKRNVLFL